MPWHVSLWHTISPCHLCQHRLWCIQLRQYLNMGYHFCEGKTTKCRERVIRNGEWRGFINKWYAIVVRIRHSEYPLAHRESVVMTRCAMHGRCDVYSVTWVKMEYNHFLLPHTWVIFLTNAVIIIENTLLHLLLLPYNWLIFKPFHLWLLEKPNICSIYKLIFHQNVLHKVMFASITAYLVNV